MSKTKDEIIAFRLIKADKDLKAARTLMAAQDWKLLSIVYTMLLSIPSLSYYLRMT